MKVQTRRAMYPMLKFMIIILLAGFFCSAKAREQSLLFDSSHFTTQSISVGDHIITFRAFENIIYVSNPVDTTYQRMHFYVPIEYFEGKSIGTFTAESAPIFFPNTVGGYMPGVPAKPGFNRRNQPNATVTALIKGFVVAAPGARGRNLKNKDGHYTGKAPACIVDLKAAVRYLRLNDKIMPGDAEKIISNGTSAGGALSSLLGATGNNKDYQPYLKMIGAADERDDIFAASCYCPITNLENADMAYEWLFNGINDYNSWGKSGKMTEEQIIISNELKSLFPSYLNSLGLTSPDGTRLVLDANGQGSFKDYVKSFLISSAQKALNEGVDLSDSSFLTVQDDSVITIDLHNFLAYATRMKTPPAFDALDLGSPENNLFGSEQIDNRHFTQFSIKNKTDSFLADMHIVKMMNPMNYIADGGTTTAKYWRIRQGAIDRDTSLAIPVMLSTMLQNCGFIVDFAMPWGQGHGGDYDLVELFAWMEQICQ